MSMTLEKYAETLDARQTPRPSGPVPRPFANAKAGLKRMPDVKGVVYCGFGTLMLITGGEPELLNSDAAMKKIALDKTLQEFNMWQSMSRKPGDPADYLEVMFKRSFDKLSMREFAGKDVYPRLEMVWKGVVETLKQKEYAYDPSMGDLDDFCRKITYYYLLRSQGVSVFEDCRKTLVGLAARGIVQGVHADAQCDAPARLLQSLREQGSVAGLHEVFHPKCVHWSFATGVKSKSERGWQDLIAGLAGVPIAPDKMIYIGSDLERDVVPAKRRGFRTALLLADQASAKVTREGLRDDRTKPDLLLTKLSQLLDVVN
jgi:hypothetical protein